MNRFIELKRSLPVNFTRELREYFKNLYKNVNVDEFDAELGELDRLRVECTNSGISQAIINTILLRYYLQLLDMETRINLDAANIKVPFAWYNCSAGDDKKIIVSSTNIRFEESCVLFNVAACYIQLGGMESESSSEGLKKACNYYMMAAGVFQFISDNLTCNFDVPTPADVSPASLNFLIKWSLTAAQECFVLKGIAENTIKDGMLAKLALATGHMYEATRELGEILGVGSIYGKSLAAFLTGRATYYKALAQVRKASESLASCRYGEEISRLNEATNLLNRCKEHKKLMDSDTVSCLDNLSGQVVRNIERAIKDNSIIYHEIVPAASGLADIGQAVVARVTVMPDWTKEPSIPLRPILSRLVPETIRLRAVEYYARRNEKIELIYGRLRQLKHFEMETLRDSNLPSLLEVSLTTMGLPASILQKSEQIRSSGGASSLYSALSTADSLKSDARQLLQQVDELLKEEKMADLRARQEYGTQWTRPESETLSKNLLQALESYKKSFFSASESDRKLQKDFDEAIAGIIALDSSQAELEESIPATTPQNSQMGDAVLASRLREKLTQVERFESLRVDLTERIQGHCKGDIIEEDFMSLGEDSLRNEEFASSVINQRLEGNPTFMKFSTEIDSVEIEQKVFLNELKVLAGSFAKSLTLNSALEERQTALKTLDQAALAYTTLTVHLQEALNFYSGLVDLLQKLRENTRDFTVSRGLEMDEIRESLGQSFGAGSTLSNYNNVNNNTMNSSMSSNNIPYRVSGFNPNQSNHNSNSFNQLPSSLSSSQYPGSAQQSNSYFSNIQNTGSIQAQQTRQWQPGMPLQYASSSNTGQYSMNMNTNGNQCNNSSDISQGYDTSHSFNQQFNNNNNRNNNNNNNTNTNSTQQQQQQLTSRPPFNPYAQ